MVGSLLILVLSAELARADQISPAMSPPDRASQTPGRAADGSHDLDGLYMALGPSVGAIYRNRTWQGGFGGELLVARVRERSRLAALGVGLGGLRYARPGAQPSAGRMWADLLIGTRVLGQVAGIGAGLTADVDEVVPPRWGGQATLWMFVGVISFVRIGSVQKSGTFIDFGIKVALPVIRI